ncbi:class E sortase [Trueperella pyogenes]|uniref:class E sortase n=1 Tax=Trueperella pyogenes TaxID=1661 RepID=UPI00046829AE|nr:class E sortase [Trueperella pyogenes]AZR01345.1 class E sortase [Trueperella pyogenes]UVJ53768.1 class E sortase [Trueperella pyogenes]UVJ57821.1 class E sortase [Trueperella pyogenes]WHU58494.1 class E sortase [Trueperella pyogenes]
MSQVKSATHRRQKPSIFARIIGVIGELMITAGLFIGLFIVWQVWWTDIEANHEQSAQISALREEYVKPDDGIAQPQPGPPPEWTGPTGENETIGIMRIPAFGYEYAYTIKNGTSLTKILDKGSFGRYVDTAFPGQVGNFSTAAHRQTYGAPMLNVPDLKEGDAIVVETPETFLVYKIVADEIVRPNAIWTIAPDPFMAHDSLTNGTPITEPTRRLLTITTCHPPFVSNERWVVHAEFDYWTKREDGLPKELVDPAKLDQATHKATPQATSPAPAEGKN